MKMTVFDNNVRKQAPPEIRWSVVIMSGALVDLIFSRPSADDMMVLGL